jgi:hypothetical protein
VSNDARRLWTVAEPIHALTYFAPEAHEAFEEAGLRGFWRGYFAGRAAPLGAASAGTVTAVFFGFHPDFVARAIPGVWSVTEPSLALEARLAGIERACRRLFGTELATDDVATAITALRTAVEATSVAGLPLFGANAGLDWPDAPPLALWHATTLLREHRGDGHVQALVVAGIDPCEAHVLRVAADEVPIDSIQPYRGWTDADWAGAAARLRERGWLDAAGRATDTGRRTRADIEAETDRRSARLVARIPDVDRVLGSLGPIAERVRGSGTVPYPNPIGVPPPAT